MYAEKKNKVYYDAHVGLKSSLLWCPMGDITCIRQVQFDGQFKEANEFIRY